MIKSANETWLTVTQTLSKQETTFAQLNMNNITMRPTGLVLLAKINKTSLQHCTDAFQQNSNKRNKPALLRGVQKLDYTSAEWVFWKVSCSICKIASFKSVKFDDNDNDNINNDIFSSVPLHSRKEAQL